MGLFYTNIKRWLTEEFLSLLPELREEWLDMVFRALEEIETEYRLQKEDMGHGKSSVGDI